MPRLSKTAASPPALTGAIWSESPVRDYDEPFAATWRRLTKSGLWLDAGKRIEFAMEGDSTLRDDEHRHRWLRTHYPPPSMLEPEPTKAVEPPKPKPVPVVKPAPVVEPIVVPTVEAPNDQPPTSPPWDDPPAPLTTPPQTPVRRRGRAAAEPQPMSPTEREDVRKLHDRKAEAADFLGDAEWVYHNLAAYAANLLKPKDAPSIGAWGLMLNAAENPQKFYADIAGKVAKARQEEVSQKRFRDDGCRDLFDLLDRLDPSGKTAGLGLVQARS